MGRNRSRSFADNTAPSVGSSGGTDDAGIVVDHLVDEPAGVIGFADEPGDGPATPEAADGGDEAGDDPVAESVVAPVVEPGEPRTVVTVSVAAKAPKAAKAEPASAELVAERRRSSRLHEIDAAIKEASDAAASLPSAEKVLEWRNQPLREIERLREVIRATTERLTKEIAAQDDLWRKRCEEAQVKLEAVRVADERLAALRALRGRVEQGTQD